jgi:putative tricarboxylic transport membrane protein
MSEGSALRRHQALIGVGALVVGALLAWGARTIPGEAGYSGVGPNFLPLTVAAALLVCGALLLAGALRGGWQHVEEPSGAARGDWPSLLWVATGIVANAALLTTVGFVLACTLCYMLAVRGLRRSEGRPQGGARGLVMDFVTGFLIAGPAYWVFTKLLGINLPGITGTGWL